MKLFNFFPSSKKLETNPDINISSSNDVLLKANIDNKSLNDDLKTKNNDRKESRNLSKDEINKLEKSYERNSLGSLNNSNKVNISPRNRANDNNCNSNSLLKENKAIKDLDEIKCENKNNNNNNFYIINSGSCDLIANKQPKKEENTNHHMKQLKIEENTSLISLEKRNSINSETVQSNRLKSKRSKRSNNDKKNKQLLDSQVIKSLFQATNSDCTDIENSHRLKHLEKEDFLNKYVVNNLIHSNFKDEMIQDGDSSLCESVRFDACMENNFRDMLRKGTITRTKKTDRSYNSRNYVERSIDSKTTNMKLSVFKEKNLQSNRLLYENIDAHFNDKQNKQKKLYSTQNNRASIIKEKIDPKKTSEEESLKRSRTHLDEKRDIDAENELQQLLTKKEYKNLIYKKNSRKESFKENKSLSRIKNQIKNNILIYSTTKSLDNDSNRKHEKFRKLIKKGLIYDSLSDDEFLFLHDRRFTFHPDSKIKIVTDFFVLVALIYSMIYLPVRLIYSETASVNFFYIELFFDLVNIFDFILGFFIGFYDFEENYISDKLEIFSYYIRTSFLTDLISGIPINSLSEFNALLRLDMKDGKNDDLFFKLCSPKIFN